MTRILLLTCLLILGWVPAAHADTSWWNQDFSFRKAITIDTMAKGGNVTTAVGRTPLLVRLHSGNFTFDGVSESGADVRFVAADDKTPLNFQIESFDPVLGVALIWVDVPQVAADAQQQIWMYYGNAKAQGGEKAGAVFDADYAAVYHFEEPAGTPPHDATAYGNHAVGNDIAGVDGIIGKSARFDGSKIVTLPGSVSMNVAEGGTFTFSTWIKLDAIADGRALVYARRQGDQKLLIGLDHGVPFVQTGDAASAAGEPVKAGAWTHLAVTAAGDDIELYVDGKPYAKLAAKLPAMTMQSSARSVRLAHKPAQASAALEVGAKLDVARGMGEGDVPTWGVRRLENARAGRRTLAASAPATQFASRFELLGDYAPCGPDGWTTKTARKTRAASPICR